MRLSFRRLAVASAIFGLTACSDSTTAPRATDARTLAPTAAAFDYSQGYGFNEQASSFTLTSRGGSFSVNGVFTLNFPDNSVCSPSRSTYGAGQWDATCSTLRAGESIKVTAKLRLTSTGFGVDFSPELRFSPSTQVTISTDIFSRVLKGNRAYFASHPSSLGFLAEYYAPTLGGAIQADYIADPTLTTHVNLTTGEVWRRIKHFSGYSDGGGNTCIPSPDAPDCVWVDGDQK